MDDGPDIAALRYNWLRDLTVNYFARLIAHGQKPDLTDSTVNGVFLTLVLCDALGQFKTLPGGFVAWLRFDMAHLETAFARDLSLVMALGREELTTGQVCFVAEVLAETPGQAYRAMRELQNLPGITHMAAWRNLTRRKVIKVNHGRKLPSESASRRWD